MNFLAAYEDESSSEDESLHDEFPSEGLVQSLVETKKRTSSVPSSSSSQQHASQGKVKDDDNVEEEEDDDDDDDEFGPQPVPVSGNNPIEEQHPSTDSSSHHNTTTRTAAEDRVDQYAAIKKIPIESEIFLHGHSKAVSCISIEPAGNRVVTGSLDYCVKLFDFGGMDSRHRPFQSIEPEDGHPVTAVSHSPSGDRFVVATGSAQPKVFDRDGKEVIKFVKGDMYLRDLSNTKGHTMEVTSLQWHPSEKNLILTASLDGSARIWDLLGEATFGMLVNKHVLKLKTSTNQRLGATACCYAPNGLRVYIGAADGSIQVWNSRKAYSKPDHVLVPGPVTECHQQTVSCLVVSPDNRFLAGRYAHGIVLLWPISTSGPAKEAVYQIPSLYNIYPTANITFSPDATLLLGCASIRGQAKGVEVEERSRLHFFDLTVAANPMNKMAQVSSHGGLQVLHSQMSITISSEGEDNAPVSAVAVKWHAATQQIFCTLSNGLVKVFYDASISKKGALLSSRKAPKRLKDPSDYAAVGEIITPLALPMFRNENTSLNKSKKRAMELKDPVLAKIPEKPVNSGPGTRMNTSFFFTEYVTNGKKVESGRHEDPREALLKYADKAKEDPLFLGKAYGTTQPQTQLHSLTFEQEQEEFKSKQRRMH
eukprot:gene1025-1109_t